MTDNDAPMQRMLPCPFCGGNAEYQTDKGPTGELYGWVGCTQCGAASDQCDVRSMQPEEIHPIDAWSARVTSPCDGRTEQLLKDVEGVANLLAQWRTTVMCRFDGSVDGDQWRELNKAFDDLATVRAALRTTPQAKPLDLPAQDEVEVVARALVKSHGLDFDECCGMGEYGDGDCDSGTCVAAYSEDHDADHARRYYRAEATARRRLKRRLQNGFPKGLES